MKQGKGWFSFACVLLLLGFSVYALLDALAISRVYAVVETDASAPAETVRTQTLSCKQAQEESEINIDTVRVNDTTVYVADIRLGASQSLRTAFSDSSYGRHVTAATSETASAVGAVLAINGDNYGAQEKGYVIRNGVIYRDAAAKGREDLVIWADGSFSIVCEDEVTARELLEQGAEQVFSFGPGLLADGEIIVGVADEVGRAKASNPRTAIGVIEDGHYVFVVSDGRSAESEGLSLYELAEFMQSLGVQTAYNLDGGGSSTMVYQGELVNKPSGSRERAVTDIVYIA